MSDIGLDWGPFDIAAIALIIGAPGLVIGAALGAILWRRHRLWGACLGAAAGLHFVVGRLRGVESKSVGVSRPAQPGKAGRNFLIPAT